MKKVIILGGGVAGMSAAHELIERGFAVEVYEANHIAGGKARSMDVTEGLQEGQKPLPGEHGFRFFPGFYKHVTDTMRRIPYKNNRRGVLDNLVNATRTQIASLGKPSHISLSQFPKGFSDFKTIIERLFSYKSMGLTEDDMAFFASRLWKLATSCPERRLAEYEGVSWWDFIEADGRSEAYQMYLAVGLTRTLVAAKAKEISIRTGGNILLQLIFDIITWGKGSDRLLNGPTNDVWIDPWLAYLTQKGVQYHLDSRIEKIHCDGQRITGIDIKQAGKQITVTGDYYIAALPVEVMEKLLNPEMEKADPRLAYLHQLADSVSWMNGIQYYLTEDIKLVHGHTIYMDSPWALTSVSQPQFWHDYDLSKCADGKVSGILSVDISDWFNAENSTIGKAAKDCTPEEIMRETWEQMKLSLNVEGEEILKDEYIHSWFLDPDIITPNDNRIHETINLEPLLINKKNTWKLRPEAITNIPNLFLAADYVRTNTDLATMEGANEAARRAVNGIITTEGLWQMRKCQIWALEEPSFLAPWRMNDKERFDKGLPWNGMPYGLDFVTDFRDKYFPAFTLY
ncbi:MAG: FAD-dependent oxidoreductase [Bacteroidetes bacterium]|nr:MAG: FAD-dependent oxidoreductase [Bacteroidota bacterium]